MSNANIQHLKPVSPKPAARKQSKRWFVYLLKCGDGTLYCGITNDLEKRIAAHNCGKGARYTRTRGPVLVVWTRRCNSRSKALQIEYATKQLSKAQKLKMIAGVTNLTVRRTISIVRTT